MLAGSNQTNFCSTSGDYVQSTEWQLEVGKNASQFENLSYTTELNLCQRYYHRHRFKDPYGPVCNINLWSGTTNIGVYYLPQVMRAIPSFSYGGSFEVYMNGATISVNTVSGNTTDQYVIEFNFSTSSPGSSASGWVRSANNLNSYLAFDADM